MGKSITDLSSVTTVGLDLAKHVFQVHGVDAFGRVIVAKALRRKDVLGFFAQLPRCLVGLEACGSAHHWARELIKLGHDARMMPPAYVRSVLNARGHRRGRHWTQAGNGHQTARHLVASRDRGDDSVAARNLTAARLRAACNDRGPHARPRRAMSTNIDCPSSRCGPASACRRTSFVSA